MAIFVIFLPILTTNWLPWRRPLDPCNQRCLLWIGQPQTAPLISNRILVISHGNAFICIYSNFCPKIGCYGDALCPLCTGVSHMNSQWHKPYPKTKLCTDVWLKTEVMAIFVIFLHILAKIWLPRQRPLDPCNQKYLLGIGRPRKPPVISN